MQVRLEVFDHPATGESLVASRTIQIWMSYNPMEALTSALLVFLLL